MSSKSIYKGTVPINSGALNVEVLLAEEVRVSNENGRIAAEAERVANYGNFYFVFGSVTGFDSVDAVADEFVLDMEQVSNFMIEPLDANAKTVTFSNIPQTDNLILSVTVLLKYSNAVDLTFPAGVIWKDGVTPSFGIDKTYMLMFVSYDKGVTWLSSFTGEW